MNIKEEILGLYYDRDMDFRCACHPHYRSALDHAATLVERRLHEWAKLLHYPEYWDVRVYPDIEDAIESVLELYNHEYMQS